MGFSKNTFLNPYDNLERQLTSPRDPHQTSPRATQRRANLADRGCSKSFYLVKNFTACEIYASGGGLLVAPTMAPLLLDIARWCVGYPTDWRAAGRDSIPDSGSTV